MKSLGGDTNTEKKSKRKKKQCSEPGSFFILTKAFYLICATLILFGVGLYFLVVCRGRRKEKQSWYDSLFSSLLIDERREEESQIYKLSHWFGMTMESVVHSVLAKVMSEEATFVTLQLLCITPLALIVMATIWCVYRQVTCKRQINNRHKQKQKKSLDTKDVDWNIFNITFVSLCFLAVLFFISLQIWLNWEEINNTVSATIEEYLGLMTQSSYLVVLLVVCSVLILSCMYFRGSWTKSQHGTSKEHYSEKSSSEHSRVLYYWRSYFMYILVICALISIPWEFVRMYQQEVAKKMSIVEAGIPAECYPRELTVWGSVKAWLKWQLSWDSSGGCERYHRALVIDPLWEVTPLMVITSAFSRCISRPIEILCHTIGNSLQLMFINIPTIWQPVVMVILTVIVLVLAIMFCRYKISVPLFVHIEPSRTPRSNRKSPENMLYSPEP